MNIKCKVYQRLYIIMNSLNKILSFTSLMIFECEFNDEITIRCSLFLCLSFEMIQYVIFLGIIITHFVSWRVVSANKSISIKEAKVSIWCCFLSHKIVNTFYIHKKPQHCLFNFRFLTKTYKSNINCIENNALFHHTLIFFTLQFY